MGESAHGQTDHYGVLSIRTQHHGGWLSRSAIVLLALSLIRLHVASAVLLHSDDPPRDDLYHSVVSTTASLHGSVPKMGMVPVERWNWKDHKQRFFFNWVWNDTLRNSGAVHGPLGMTHPLSGRCVIWVNHEYKIIVIRNRKAASSTLQGALGGECNKENRPRCLEGLSSSLTSKQKKDIPGLWNDYFVLTTTRNPFARHASAYDYIISRWYEHKKAAGRRCEPPSFETVCRDPTILGRTALENKCKKQRKVGQKTHDFTHVEPSAACASTAEGLPAFDFAIRVEHFDEDFAEAAEIINSRRDKRLPAFERTDNLWKNQGLAAAAAAANSTAILESSNASELVRYHKYAQIYRSCGITCVTELAKYVTPDILLFYNHTSLAELLPNRTTLGPG